MAKRLGRRTLIPDPEFPDLATYLLRTGDTQANIARVLNAKQAHISRIVAGKLVPRPELADRLARYARIPLESFTRVYLARQAEEQAAS